MSGRRARTRKAEQADRVQQTGQEVTAQRGDGEIDVGELDAIGERPNVVDPLPGAIPVMGQAETGVGATARAGRIGPVGAVSGHLERSAVDAHLHAARRADPTSDQADAAFGRALGGRFQQRPR